MHRRVLLFVLMAAFVLSFIMIQVPISARPPSGLVPQNATREEVIQALAGMIRDIPVAMLTTTGLGRLRSRPMVAQRLPFDGSLWFLTSRTAAKAGEVRNRHRVNVSYASPERDCYVSIAGLASLVDDRQRAAALWNTSYEPWLPRGLDDPDLVLIRVEAEEAEYWDAAAGKMVIVSELLQGHRAGRARQRHGDQFCRYSGFFSSASSRGLLRNPISTSTDGAFAPFSTTLLMPISAPSSCAVQTAASV